MRGTIYALLITLVCIACDSDRATEADNTGSETTVNERETEAQDAAPPALYAQPTEELTYQELSQGLLEAVRDDQDRVAIQERLATVDPEALAATLDTREKKLAFWMNIYNGYIQTVLQERPDLYEDRRNFFGEKLFTIAGKELSFEDVEHGIIRGSESKILMGYAGKLFVGDYEKMFRVDETDPRIHFALNCGAIDCPPVYIFNAATINDDLETLTRAYLQKHSTYDAEKNVVTTTPLFKWFKGDFQSYDGVDDFLVRYGIVPAANKESVKREYKDYDWTLDLDNFG